MRRRYKGRGRKGRSLLVSELVETLGYSRKHATKVLGGKLPVAGESGKRRGGRGAIYGAEEEKVLRAVWKAGGYPGGKRLAAMMEHWIEGYERSFGTLHPRVRANLLRMSAATVDRLLAPYKIKLGKRRCCTTKPGTLTSIVEVKTSSRGVLRPGYIEADTVAHCGGSAEGSHGWSLTCTDICTGWTELRAFWNKGQEAVRRAAADIEENLPFPLLSFDCDNGSEFLNWHLHDHFRKRRKPVEFTRSRPYKKNDQAHVEQKNWTHVRQLVGYDRLWHPRQTEMLDALYRHEVSLLNNLFTPCMKCSHILKEPGKRPRRRYGKPATPLDRLAAHPDADPSIVTRLKELRSTLNPFVLSRAIARKIDAILAYKP